MVLRAKYVAICCKDGSNLQSEKSYTTKSKQTLFDQGGLLLQRQHDAIYLNIDSTLERMVFKFYQTVMIKKYFLSA